MGKAAVCFSHIRVFLAWETCTVCFLESVSMKLKALWSQRSRKALYRKQKGGLRNTAPETMTKVAHVQG